MRIFQFDGVDQINAEVAVHGLIAKDVHVLLCSAGHLVLAAKRQDLREANVEEQAFHEASEDDQRLQQRLVGFGRARLEVGVRDRVDERDQELVFGADGRNFVVSVEDLGFVQVQAFDDVLIGVRVDGFFECLAQQELAAFRRRDVAVGAQHDVVRGQRVGRDEETQVALDDAALVLGEPVRVLPEGDVARHVDLLRHPVVGASRQVLFPSPLVLEGHKLVDVRLAVDDALVGNLDALRGGCTAGGQAGRVFRRGRRGHGGVAEYTGRRPDFGRSLPTRRGCGGLCRLRCDGVVFPINHDSFSGGGYWQASHSSKPGSPGRMVQTAPRTSGSGKTGAAATDEAVDWPLALTAFNSPPRPVDFSALVAPRVRR
ncbi:hypothetical protein D3C85_1034980 [compost metagenome]